MTDVKKFVSHWSGRGYEKGETHTFWLSFLRGVLGVSEPENFINFEVPIPHGFIDALIPNTKVLIEQKSSTVNLDDVEIFRQAKRYNDALEYSRKARWIITCNFKEFRVFDMDKRYSERDPIKISLFELPKRYSALNFLVELQDKISYERELSIQARKLITKLSKTSYLVVPKRSGSITLIGLKNFFVNLFSAQQLTTPSRSRTKLVGVVSGCSNLTLRATLYLGQIQ